MSESVPTLSDAGGLSERRARSAAGREAASAAASLTLDEVVAVLEHVRARRRDADRRDRTAGSPPRASRSTEVSGDGRRRRRGRRRAAAELVPAAADRSCRGRARSPTRRLAAPSRGSPTPTSRAAAVVRPGAHVPQGDRPGPAAHRAEEVALAKRIEAGLAAAHRSPSSRPYGDRRSSPTRAPPLERIVHDGAAPRRS